jgi:hypothetical protein
MIRNILGRRKPKIPPWISHSDRHLIEALDFRSQTPPVVSEMGREKNYLKTLREYLQSPFNLFFIEHRYFYAKHIGFTNLFPYFDLDLMDLAYRIRPEILVSEGLIKAPLQRFLHENLPGIQLPKKKTDYMNVTHTLLRLQGRHLWSEIGGAKTLQNLDIINSNNAKASMDSYFTGQNQLWNVAWQLLSAEIWLRMWDS